MPEPARPLANLEATLEALHEASYGWARSCCRGDPDDAADVLQNAYVKVLSGSAVWSEKSSFRTWFFGVIRLTALESARHKGRELLFAAPPDHEDASTPVDVALIHAEEAQALREALAQLPERQREVLHLVFHAGMTVADAASAMGVTVGSARVHYDRGKRRLRALLGLQERGDADGIA